MKVLVALHKVMDLGGIINHTEQLIGGFKDLGHQVDFRQFVWSETVRDSSIDGNWLVGPSGIRHDQGKGWEFKAKNRIAYKGIAALRAAQQFLAQFDVVIWTLPVPSANALNLGNSDWIHLHDLPKEVRQVGFIHDGNAERGYPHLLALQDKLVGLACVHHCALNSSSFTTIPRGLILNPQFQPQMPPVVSWHDKGRGFVNMQTFKAWKHVHELIEAIAYMPPKDDKEFRHVAGDGIEARYMRSEDKCKPQYYHADGRKFWDAALDNGMIMPGYWTAEQVDAHLEWARVLVDPSWSDRYSKFGGHYNRVAVDAMMRGCVVVARRKGMGTDLFCAGEHYIEVPEGASPQEYADTVLEAGNMGTKEAAHYTDAVHPLLGLFDRKLVATQVLALAFEQLSGIRKSESTPKAIIKKADDLLFSHFGII